MAGNDVVMKQTSFNICMPETKEVLQLLLVSPCYNSCSATAQQIWKNERLQLLFYNRKRVTHRMDVCNWTCELTHYPWKKGWLQMLVWKKYSTLKNTRSRQVASWNNDGTTQMQGCKCYFEIKIRRNRNISQIHLIYSIHGCKTSSKK